MATNRICIKCNISYPALPEFFFYRNKARGWLSSWCKDCKKNYVNQNKDKGNLQQRIRRGLTPCKVCGSERKSKGNTYCDTCLKLKKRAVKKADKCIYKSRLRKAMPVWAEKQEIKDFYKNRPLGYHVDHIIPIRGESVSGLHVFGNLQYLKGEDNMRKSNHYSLEHNGYK